MEELKVLGKVVGCVMGEDFNAIRVWENISGQKKQEGECGGLKKLESITCEVKSNIRRRV